ncbi:hypothetical protein ACQJBY_047094 [Aegilops geniculata]
MLGCPFWVHILQAVLMVRQRAPLPRVPPPLPPQCKLLKDHYAGARAVLGLRLLGSQGAGAVLFCLFPAASRGKARLPAINFDALLSALTNNVRCRFCVV